MIDFHTSRKGYSEFRERLFLHMPTIKEVWNYNISKASILALSLRAPTNATTKSVSLKIRHTTPYLLTSLSTINRRAFEFVDFNDLTRFIIDYDDFQLVSTPEFLGAHVQFYIHLRDLTDNLKIFQWAFPNAKDDDVSFDQCPSNFNADAWMSSTTHCKSLDRMKPVASARLFQRSTVRQCHPDCDEPYMSMYLGLLGIDEAASKECGSITSDLLLRTGILVENEVDG